MLLRDAWSAIQIIDSTFIWNECLHKSVPTEEFIEKAFWKVSAELQAGAFSAAVLTEVWFDAPTLPFSFAKTWSHRWFMRLWRSLIPYGKGLKSFGFCSLNVADQGYLSILEKLFRGFGPSLERFCLFCMPIPAHALDYITLLNIVIMNPKLINLHTLLLNFVILEMATDSELCGKIYASPAFQRAEFLALPVIRHSDSYYPTPAILSAFLTHRASSGHPVKTLQVPYSFAQAVFGGNGNFRDSELKETLSVHFPGIAPQNLAFGMISFGQYHLQNRSSQNAAYSRPEWINSLTSADDIHRALVNVPCCTDSSVANCVLANVLSGRNMKQALDLISLCGDDEEMYLDFIFRFSQSQRLRMAAEIMARFNFAEWSFDPVAELILTNKRVARAVLPHGPTAFVILFQQGLESSSAPAIELVKAILRMPGLLEELGVDISATLHGMDIFDLCTDTNDLRLLAAAFNRSAGLRMNINSFNIAAAARRVRMQQPHEDQLENMLDFLQQHHM